MHLPPLAAIRAFEAAARLLSFTRAAEELAMTQAAVSYQIKVLEERVGQPLFIRKPRQVELTETGSALAAGASEAFRILAESYEQARTGGQGTLSISTIPTFAVSWFAPHLGSFQIKHPIDRGAAGNGPSGHRPRAGEYRHRHQDRGPGRVARAGVAPAVPCRFHADAQPDACRHDRRRQATGRPAQAADPRRRAILVAHMVRPRRHRRTRKPRRRGPAASSVRKPSRPARLPPGVGVAILTRELFADELANGSLIQPFDIVGNDGHSYWLVYQEARRNLPKIRAFRDWMLAEIGASTGKAV